MTENGPLWFEQADMLAEYLIENQSEEGLCRRQVMHRMQWPPSAFMQEDF